MSLTLRAPSQAFAESLHSDQIKVGRQVFTRIETGSSSKAWRCEELAIQIIERVREPGRLWEYVAARIKGAGDQPQYLSRRQYIRTFTNPLAAAKAALTEWS